VIPIRTRADIYGQEATELLRLINLYPGLQLEQLRRFFPEKENSIQPLLAHLQRQGRILRGGENAYFPYTERQPNVDTGLVRAVWVLLDFLNRTDYHSASDFPVKIAFFADGELYEIIYVAEGQEALVSHILSQNKADSSGGSRRIVIVDRPAQIPRLEFPGISGFCTVDNIGHVRYYKKSCGMAQKWHKNGRAEHLQND